MCMPKCEDLFFILTYINNKYPVRYLTKHHSQSQSETSSDEMNQLFKWMQAKVMALKDQGCLWCSSLSFGKKATLAQQSVTLVHTIRLPAKNETPAGTLLICYRIIYSEANINSCLNTRVLLNMGIS